MITTSVGLPDIRQSSYDDKLRSGHNQQNQYANYLLRHTRYRKSSLLFSCSTSQNMIRFQVLSQRSRSKNTTWMTSTSAHAAIQSSEQMLLAFFTTFPTIGPETVCHHLFLICSENITNSPAFSSSTKSTGLPRSVHCWIS